MCGLAGLVGAAPAAALAPHVATMLSALQHRGPDGDGLLAHDLADAPVGVVLGHRRLAIIDRTPLGAQPMASADGRTHVILNGEIVNYVELRAELVAQGITFRSASDTEVLLEAWRAWGAAALTRLEWMFAFALLDLDRRELVLARDPFAIKPLYYATLPGRLAFASEIPPLLALPGMSRRADPAPLREFLDRSVNAIPGTTLFADVREIPGAHFARIALDGALTVHAESYWQPPQAEREPLTFAAAVSGLRERLEASVARHLRSDVPVGLLLSGGLDSSATLALARRALGPQAPIHVFSYRAGDGAVDEGRWQAAAREAAGAIGHDVHLTADEWARDLHALVASQGEPFASPVIYAQRRLYQAAAEQGIKVVLDGQGADEYLAGYGRFDAARIAGLMRAHRWGALARTLAAHARAGRGMRAPLAAAVALAWPARAGSALARRQRAQGLSDDRWMAARGAGDDSHHAVARRRDDLLRQQLGDSLSAPSLPWLMRYADRNAMAHSIENRVPFLDRPLVDWVLGLPERHFVGEDGTPKALLRAAMRGLVPDVVIDRRERMGFDVPAEVWLARTPGVADLLAEGAVLPPVRSDAARDTVAAMRAGARLTRPQAFAAWRLVTLAAWQRATGATFD